MSNHRPAREVPTVPGLPLVGSMFDLLERPVGFLVDALHKHGPVFRIKFPGARYTFIGGALAREILNDPPACPMSRAGLFRPFANEVGVEVFDTEGEAHDRARALLKLPYSRQITSELLPEIEAAVIEGMSAWGSGDKLDLFKVACDLAQRAMMAVVTPIDLRSYADDFVRAGNHVMYAQFQLLPEVTLKDPTYKRAYGRMLSIIEEAIDRHRAGEFAGDPKTYMIDACLRASNEAGDTMDTQTIRGACFYALAGTEIYVGRLVGFLLYELLRNRHYMASVLAEVDSAPRGEHLAGAFRRMPHLRAAYTETLRCYPLIPGYMYSTRADMTLGGFRVAKGETVVFAPYLSHFSGEHYANPMAFDPARHLRPPRELASAGALTPFGVGMHACAATGMVETITLAVVTTVLRSVDLDLDNPAYEMSLRLAPLIRPKKPIWTNVRQLRAPPANAPSVSALSESPDYQRAAAIGASAPELPAKEPATIPRGEWLIKEGERANAFFVVLEGKLSIQRADGEPGRPGRSSEAEAGSCFGDAALLRDASRTTSVRVERDAKVLRFSGEELERLVSEHDLTARDIGSLYYGRYSKSVLRSSLS